MRARGTTVVRALLTLLALVAGVLASGLAPSSAYAEEPVALIQVTLKSINPALPTRDGQITLTGTATNITSERIFRAQAYVWRNQAPITDREGFDQAARLRLQRPAGQPGGRRLPEPVRGDRPLPGTGRDPRLHADRPGRAARAVPDRRHLPDGRPRPAEQRSGRRRPGPGVRPGRRDPADRAAADDLAGHLHLAAVPGPHRGAGRRPPGPRGRPERPAEQAARRGRRGRPELRRRPGAARRPADHGRRLLGAGR